MKKIIFAVLFIVLFSGCMPMNIKGVNFTTKINDNERTFSVGDGWQYSFTAVITNSSPGAIAHILVMRDNGMKDIAQLRPGETYTEKLTSSMCYGNRGGYSSWNNRSPEVVYKVNFYKGVDGNKTGVANAEFVGTLTNKFTMFDCQDPINKFVSWDIGGYSGQGGHVIR